MFAFFLCSACEIATAVAYLSTPERRVIALVVVFLVVSPQTEHMPSCDEVLVLVLYAVVLQFEPL